MQCVAEMMTKEYIKERLSKFQNGHYTFNNAKATSKPLRLASVLIPLFIKNGEVFVLLTRRSNTVGSHKGEVCFPGGKMEEKDEDEIVTCLREAEEEINLQPDQVEIISRIPPRISRHGYLIIPIVGLIPDDFKASPNSEVESAFSLPLSRFLSNQGYNQMVYDMGETKPLIHFFKDQIDGSTYTTWGLTANMCIELAVALFQQEPEFDVSLKYKMTKENPFYIQKMFLKDYFCEKSKL